jgi:hypothetical protein
MILHTLWCCHFAFLGALLAGHDSMGPAVMKQEQMGLTKQRYQMADIGFALDLVDIR